jgi:hypothetical protein
MLGHTRFEVAALTFVALIVLYAHRAEIKEILAGYGYRKDSAPR